MTGIEIMNHIGKNQMSRNDQRQKNPRGTSRNPTNHSKRVRTISGRVIRQNAQAWRLFVQRSGKAASLDSHQIPTDSIDDRLENRQSIESHDRKVQNKAPGTRN